MSECLNCPNLTKQFFGGGGGWGAGDDLKPGKGARGVSGGSRGARTFCSLRVFSKWRELHPEGLARRNAFTRDWWLRLCVGVLIILVRGM